MPKCTNQDLIIISYNLRMLKGKEKKKKPQEKQYQEQGRTPFF